MRRHHWQKKFFSASLELSRPRGNIKTFVGVCMCVYHVHITLTQLDVFPLSNDNEWGARRAVQYAAS